MTFNKAVAAVLVALPALAHAQATAPASAQPNPRPDWAGTWQGTLVNLPLRAGAPVVTVRAEIGPWPTGNQGCALWRRTYTSSAHPAQVKDYRLCRGAGEDEWVVDEGDGVKLPGRLIGDVLVTPFKYGKLILHTTTRLRGDTLEEEIFTVDDKPAEEGPLALNARGIQRMTFKRIAP
jgi:hypothetical protein